MRYAAVLLRVWLLAHALPCLQVAFVAQAVRHETLQHIRLERYLGLRGARAMSSSILADVCRKSGALSDGGPIAVDSPRIFAEASSNFTA